MRFLHRFRAVVLIATLAAAFSVVAADHADARRGGSFGSRGFRTYTAPAPTRTAPNQGQTINRSMTPRDQAAQPASRNPAAANQAAQAGRRGMFGGMFGGLLGGLMLGGLIGMLLGHGIGGMAGFLGLLLQIGIIALGVMLIMRFMRGKRPEPALANAGGQSARPFNFDFGRGGTGSDSGSAPARGTSSVPTAGAGYDVAREAPASAEPFQSGQDEVGITNADLDQFEQLLMEVQAAFAREDYAGLRARCTPEIVSFLSEELSENAVNGRRNDVSDVRLLQGDLSEAWREDDSEYATVAMHYESVDVMRDRQSGEIVSGNETPTETTEIWTFVRPVGGEWKLSAIQET